MVLMLGPPLEATTPSRGQEAELWAKRRWGGVVIQGLWKRNKTCILEICVTDTDAKAYKGLSSRTMLDAVAWVKQTKYLKVCLDQ